MNLNTGKTLSLLTLTLILSCLFLNENLFAHADTVTDFSSPQTYKATATPLSTLDIFGGFDNEYKGTITYVPRPGDLFSGPILDTQGNVVEEGNVLIQMETNYRDAQVTQAQAAVDGDIANLETLAMLYKRYQEIAEKGKGALSAQDILAAKNKWLQAKATLEADKAALILAKALRSICTYYARFDGVVNKVYFPGGYVGNFGEATLNVSQLVPMGINVKMSREDAFALGVETPVLVYPIGSNTPVEVYRGHGRLIDDGVQIIVTNYITAPGSKKLDNGKIVSVVNNISTVVPFTNNMENKALSIDTSFILKDSKGSYVYKATNRNTAIGAGINPLMTLKKVYVELANRINPIEPSVNYIMLKNTDSLKENDLLVLPPKYRKGCSDGDTVYYMMKRYLFMPGDPIKVVIGGKN